MATARREHEWDSLRAVLMLLGIPYHAAMAYNTRVAWDIHSPDGSEFLTFLTGMLITFRMPAFFIVAGYFAGMILARKPVLAWLKNRYMRLAIPFVTCLLLLGPPQLLFINLSEALNGRLTMDAAMAKTLSDIRIPGFDWILHLWFLPALLFYCTLLAGIRLVTGHPAAERKEAENRPARHVVIALAVMLVFAALWEIDINFIGTTLLASESRIVALIGRGIDPYFRYLPYFFLGVLYWQLPLVRRALTGRGEIVLPVIGLIAAVVASISRGRNDMVLDTVHSGAMGIAAILLSRWIIGLAYRYGAHPRRSVQNVVDASFTIYLVHHPLIELMAVGFILVPWPPVVEFAIMCVVTLILSYAAHQLLRKSAIALFLFNGIRRKSAG